MDWLHPTYLGFLAAVPVALALYGWAERQRRAAYARFGDAALVRRLAVTVRPGRRYVKAGLVVTAVALAAFSLAGPRLGTKVREVERKGIDLVIALDVSQSMLAEDVAPNRLERAKNEIKQLLGELSGDRVGLVLFAGEGFVQCPLTTDYGAVRLFLDIAEPDLVPTPGTSFRGAFDAAMQAFSPSSRADTAQAPVARSRALLVVSDGENHIGGHEAIRQDAQAWGIVLFTAGVGEREGVPIPVYRNGRRVGVKKDRSGQVVQTRLHEEALTDLVDGGAYFRIARTSSALSDLTTALGRLEKTAFGAERFEEYEEMYQWPLALALLLLAIERMLPARAASRRRPVLPVGS